MKKIVSLLLALIMCFCIVSTAYAEVVSPAVENEIVSVSDSDSDEPTRVEETKWYYRTLPDGTVQARLWSITYRYWKTDWINVGHT